MEARDLEIFLTQLENQIQLLNKGCLDKHSFLDKEFGKIEEHLKDAPVHRERIIILEERWNQILGKLEDLKSDIKNVNLKLQLLDNNFREKVETISDEVEKKLDAVDTKIWKTIGLILGIPAVIVAIIVIIHSFTK